MCMFLSFTSKLQMLSVNCSLWTGERSKAEEYLFHLNGSVFPTSCSQEGYFPLLFFADPVLKVLSLSA